MSTAAAVLQNTQIGRSTAHTATIYLKEAKYEFLKSLRLRVYSVSVIAFPLMFYVLFGLVLNSKEALVGGMSFPTYLIATYGTFGVMGASLFGTASGLAADRGLGWLQVKRASPMPPFAYFLAKAILAMIFSAIVVSLLLTLGIIFGGVHMPLAQIAQAARNAGRRIDSVLCHGPGDRLLCRTKFRAFRHQPVLLPIVVLQRPVGALHVLAQADAADRTRPAALSLVAIGAWSGRRRTPRVRRHPLGSSIRLHPDLPGHRPHRLPARSGKVVRLNAPRAGRERCRAERNAGDADRIRIRARIHACRSSGIIGAPSGAGFRIRAAHRKEHPMSATKKGYSSTLALMLLGTLALCGGARWLPVLIPAAILICYATVRSTYSRSRN